LFWRCSRWMGCPRKSPTYAPAPLVRSAPLRTPTLEIACLRTGAGMLELRARLFALTDDVPKSLWPERPHSAAHWVVCTSAVSLPNAGIMPQCKLIFFPVDLHPFGAEPCHTEIDLVDRRPPNDAPTGIPALGLVDDLNSPCIRVRPNAPPNQHHICSWSSMQRLAAAHRPSASVRSVGAPPAWAPAASSRSVANGPLALCTDAPHAGGRKKIWVRGPAPSIVSKIMQIRPQIFERRNS